MSEISICYIHFIKCELSNSIVRECISFAAILIQLVIGYNLAFYRENFNISSLEHVKLEPLSIKRQSLVQYYMNYH